MLRKIVPIFVIFTVVCIGKTRSIPANETTTNDQDLETFCKQSCSKPNWEYRINGIVCACWVDDTIDDVDADVMKTTASKQGYIMWIIQRTNPVNQTDTTQANPVKRDIPSTTPTEEPKPEQSTAVQTTAIPQPPTDVAPPSTDVKIPETKTRMSDIDERKELKKTTLKKFRTTGTTEKGFSTLHKPAVLTHESVLGDTFHKSLKNKLTPTINRRQGLVRGCSADGVKISLQGLKQHAGRLFDRADQGSLTCALMIAELEAMKISIQQLINRSSEKKEGDRSNIFEQIKERQARMHSRLGHFELPKRPAKLNLVGAIHKKEKSNKSKIITQPPESIDE